MIADEAPTGRQFANRADAGNQLAAALDRYRTVHPLVLGIPRGGVPLAAEIADALNGDLDVIVARKIGAPSQPELAIGAVTADGGLFLNSDILSELGVSDAYLNRTIASESAIAREREARFRGGRPAPEVGGRTVIVVDDGLATGATMRAAVNSIKKQRPERLIVAVPCGSEEAVSALTRDVDDVVCLITPDPFWAVGYYYRDFLPVDDGEVNQLLREHRHRSETRGPAAQSEPEPM